MTSRGNEAHLFENCFELVLNEDYEVNFKYRDVVRKEVDTKARNEYRQSLMVGSGHLSPSVKKLPTSVIAPANIKRLSVNGRNSMFKI